MANQDIVKKLYRGVIADVVNGLRFRPSFTEEMLMKLQKILENKLAASKALEPVPDTPETSLYNQLTRSQQSANTTSWSTAGSSGGPSLASAATKPTTAVRMVEIEITVPKKSGNTTEKSIPVLVPAHALQGGTAGAKLEQVLRCQSVTAALALPVEIARVVLQQHINTAFNKSMSATNNSVKQLDGPGDSDDDGEEEEQDGLEDSQEMQDDDKADYSDDDHLNSEDDLSDDNFSTPPETDNVVICQFDKITRTQNRWKFTLRDGIMNINGRDYIFQKGNGEAVW